LVEELRTFMLRRTDRLQIKGFKFLAGRSL